MGITTRTRANGDVVYVVQIRKRREGKLVLNIAETFDGSYDVIHKFTNDKELYSAFNYPLFFAINDCLGKGEDAQKLADAFKPHPEDD